MQRYISQERDVNAYPESEFMLFYNTRVSTGIWKHANGLESFYGFVINENSTKCIVISQGRSESVIKYAEFIYELYQNGYTVFIFDHQGQGRSTRGLPNPHIGYVKSFNDFVEDLHVLITKVLDPLLEKHNQVETPKVLLCHSMGSTIGLLFVQTYPRVFTKLILSAPMLGIAAPLSENFIMLLLKTVVNIRSFFNLPVKYFFGQANYKAYPFKINRLTNSEARYRIFCEMMAQYPQNQLGGISFEWFLEAIKAMREVRKNAASLLLPTLVLLAEEEKIVDNDKAQAFLKKVPNGRVITVPNAQHELLFEQDEARELAINEMLDFIK
jgi:lysophospholipase